MKKISYFLIICLFLSTPSVNAMDYNKIIIGKWNNNKNETIFEFYTDGKMIFNLIVFGKLSGLECKYKLVGNEIKFEILDESRKGVFVIDKYEKDTLYMYVKENGEKTAKKFTRVKEK